MPAAFPHSTNRMKVTLHSVNTTGGADQLLATLTVNAAGHAVCEPPAAITRLLRDGGLDVKGRHVRITDGKEFLQALMSYPLGGYTYARAEPLADPA